MPGGCPMGWQAVGGQGLSEQRQGPDGQNPSSLEPNLGQRPSLYGAQVGGLNSAMNSVNEVVGIIGTWDDAQVSAL